MGWNYVFQWVTTLPLEFTAASIAIQVSYCVCVCVCVCGSLNFFRCSQFSIFFWMDEVAVWERRHLFILHSAVDL